jgi:hypothetical protein
LFLTQHIILSKTRLLTVVLCLCFTTVAAQKYGIGLAFGHQYGINRLDHNDQPFPSQKKYSMGNGVSRQLMFHVFPDSSNWYLSFGLNHITGNDVKTAHQQQPGSPYYQVANRSNNALRFIARASYVVDIRAYSLNFSAGVILPLVSHTQEEYFMKDSIKESRTVSTIKHFTSFGFNGSIGVSRQIASKIRLFVNSDIIILNHQVRNRKIESYESSTGQTLSEAYPDMASVETVYHKEKNARDIRNNKDVFAPGFNKNLPTDKLAYRVSESGIGLQFGFIFLF